MTQLKVCVSSGPTALFMYLIKNNLKNLGVLMKERQSLEQDGKKVLVQMVVVQYQEAGWLMEGYF